MRRLMIKRPLIRVLRSLSRLAWLLGALPTAALGQALDWPDWAEDEERLRQRIDAVNEGQLAFMARPPQGSVHHHRSHIVISRQSLIDGWVVLEQCHENLDRVTAAQILFNPRRSRALQVVSFRNMDAAYAEANSVQLLGIRAGSSVCLRLESRALHPLEGGVFELRNGPFMRRFLDGYYPLQLSLLVDYPANLSLIDIAPAAQPGFEVSERPGQVSVEALFEGRLHTRFRFAAD